MLSRVFLTVCNMTLTGSFVIGFILLARLCLRRLPRTYSYVLWAIAGLRLLLPFSIESALSLIPVRAKTFTSDVWLADPPAIDSGIVILDDVIITAMQSPGMIFEAPVKSIQMKVFVAALLWLLGVIGFVGYNLFLLLRLRRRLSDATHVGDDYAVSSTIDMPFVLGALHPRIYLPSGLDDDACALILLHERAHVRRHDTWAKLIGFVALALHWFNPLVHYAFRCFEQDMEMACDEAVMRGMADDRRAEYSRLLLALSSGRHMTAPHLAFGESDAGVRIKHVLNYRKPALWICIIALVAVILLSVLLFFQPYEEVRSPDEETTVPHVETSSSISDAAIPQTIPSAQKDTAKMTLVKQQIKSEETLLNLSLPEGWTYDTTNGPAFYAGDELCAQIRILKEKNNDRLQNDNSVIIYDTGTMRAALAPSNEKNGATIYLHLRDGETLHQAMISFKTQDITDETLRLIAAEATLSLLSTAVEQDEYYLRKISFPVYEIRDNLPQSTYIDPITITLPLPKEWTAYAASTEQITDRFNQPFHFYDGNSVVGTLNYSTATWIEEGKGDYMMYFQGYMGGSIIAWDVDTEMVSDTGSSGVAITTKRVNQMDAPSAAGSTVKYYPAMLIYLRKEDTIYQIAIEFAENAFDRETLRAMAEKTSIALAEN